MKHRRCPFLVLVLERIFSLARFVSFRSRVGVGNRYQAVVGKCPDPSAVSPDRLVGIVGKASVSGAADLGSIPAFTADPFPGRVISVTERLAVQGLPARRLTQKGQLGNWLARCQYTERQKGKMESLICNFFSQRGNTYIRLRRSVPEIHYSMLLGRHDLALKRARCVRCGERDHPESHE